MRHEINIQEFSPLVREFAGYKSAIQGCSPRTVEQYLIDLRTFFRYLLCRDDPKSLHDPEVFSAIRVDTVDLDRLRQVTTEDIYDFLLFTDAERDNHSAARARKLSAVKALFRFLVTKRGLLETDPAVNIDSPKRRKALPKFLSLEESLSLLKAVDDDRKSPNRERDYAIITLFLNCGLRVGEMSGLNLPDLDRDLRAMRVVGKGNKERMIYLNDACRSALASYLLLRLDDRHRNLPDKAVFLSNRLQRMTIQTIQAMVQKYLKRAGLEAKHYSVHKLRHTAATLMYQSGEVDIRVLKDILGHEQLNTTQIYTHVSDSSMREAIAHNPLSTVQPDGDDGTKFPDTDETESP